MAPWKIRDDVRKLVRDSPPLMISHDMANRTKHRVLKSARAGTGAGHELTYTLITVVGETVVDTYIDTGDGQRRSGLEVASECIGEWERILRSVGLPIDR